MTPKHEHRIVRNASPEAGIEKNKAHPHILCRSFAVNAVLQRVPLLILQKWLGHSDNKNTMLYLQILSEDTRNFFRHRSFDYDWTFWIPYGLFLTRNRLLELSNMCTLRGEMFSESTKY
ncbi:MAG: tyrosine-type recombinase/integrase [Deltaproteobacteria bacterium]|nr:tyrosine-type recombinase/integrase [Deltaproteobacteria bacterium]